MARTWALTYGTAWVPANELLTPPGIFCDYRYIQSCLRTMARVDVYPETMPYIGIAKLYRLNQETIDRLMQTKRSK